MKNVSPFLFLSGAFALAGLVGCSSSSPSNNGTPDGGSSTTDGATTQHDSGSTTQTDSGSTNTNLDSGNAATTDGATTTADAAPACQAMPSLYPVTAPDAGVYCPHSKQGDAGTLYCANNTQTCCVSTVADGGAATCMGASACTQTNFGPWSCAAPTDCIGAPVDGGGEPLVCCLLAGPASEETAGCASTWRTDGFDSMTCMAASACTGQKTVGTYKDQYFVVCEANSDCVGSDAGCTPMETAGSGIGVCNPNGS